MKQIDALKLGDQVWIRKRVGYRIRCLEFKDGERHQIFMPAESEVPMDSDVACWRLAHKLVDTPLSDDDSTPRFTQITVVDDLGEPVDYYVTAQPLVLGE